MLTENVVQKCRPKMSKMFWRPKIVRQFVITHYIYKLFPACQMFSDCHWCTERNAHCNICHWTVAETETHNRISSRNAWTLLLLMACLKIVQENIGWPTEVRIGLGLFRKSQIFRLRFTPLFCAIADALPLAAQFALTPGVHSGVRNSLTSPSL